jgi:protein ImuB
MRRFLFLWFPFFPTDRWRRLRPELADKTPLALCQSGPGGLRLTAVNVAAFALGLAVGMRLADSRALVPELRVADAEPQADMASLAALTDWCGRYSPWCGVDGVDGLRIDITGCAHLFGGEEAMICDAARRLRGFGFTAIEFAIADTPAASWGWARYRPSGVSPILAPGEDGLLLDLPVAALRLQAETLDTLKTLGLDSIGSVARLPRAPLGRRLGPALLERLDRMFGRLAEPISPRALVEPWRARRIFAEPIGRREDIDAVTLGLGERLCHDLSLKGRGARRLELSFYRVDGTVQRLEIGTSMPSHTARHLMRLFAERLNQVDPGFGIEAMLLEATETGPVTPAQGAFDGPDDISEVDLGALIDRLQNRLGANRVVALMSRESHMPERAQITQNMLHPRQDRGDDTKLTSRHPIHGCPPPIKAARPIKLLPIPEPVTAMAPVPDDPPLSFRWRRAVHIVVAADGPERIGPEWWIREAPRKSRDYYRLEDSTGRRFWLYREGLYGGHEPPRWFMHGFFA